MISRVPLTDWEKQEKKERVAGLLNHDLPPLIDVPIPRHVRDADWFHKSDLGSIVEIIGFPAYRIGPYSGKVLPAYAILRADEKAGKHDDCPVLVCPSSGNFVKDVGFLSLMYNIRGVIAMLNSGGVPPGKLHHMVMAGVEPAYAPKGVLGTDFAYTYAKEHGHLLVDQYVREESIDGHELSMRHIAFQMMHRRAYGGFNFGSVVGTCSTSMAGKKYLPRYYMSGEVRNFAVASKDKKERVPGSRAPENLLELESIGGFGATFYKNQKDFLEFPLITSVLKSDAFALNQELVQIYDIPVGPTGALLVEGACQLLKRAVEEDSLKSLMNGKTIRFVLFFMDNYMPYDEEDYVAFFR